MAKPLHIVNNLPTEVPAVSVSAGVADAGKLPELDGNGRLSVSMMPTGVAADVKIIQASESLAAGDFVNIHDVAGATRVRLANASSGAATRAHGYVLDNVTTGTNATVYFEGANTQVTGLTSGLNYVLSNVTPGKLLVLASAPTTAGHILQELGVADATTELNVEIGKPIVRG
ncbi:MAG: hypothetical protein ABIR46_00765 [Candidatus Saccharimonadales bacterium]